MYGASVVSGHFGDVLWELSPPAAGEVLVRARTPRETIRGCVVRELGSHDLAEIEHNAHNNILPTHTAAPAQI